MSKDLRFFGQTDTGNVRTNNEDYFKILPYGCIIADGMGGRNAGEVASQMTVDYLHHELQEQSTQEHIKQKLFHLVQHVNLWVYNLSSASSDYHGMGTTLCTLIFDGSQAYYTHVGDSRIYRFRKKKLSSLTKDHSVGHDPRYQKIFTQCVVANLPNRKLLTKAIGTQKSIKNLVIEEEQTYPGDLYLLCTDGLTDFVSKNTIYGILDSNQTLSEKTDALINAAKQEGGKDNITVVLVEVKC